MGSHAAFVGNVVKGLYIILFWIMAAAMAELLIVQGYTSCFHMLARYSIQAAAELTTYGILFGSWAAYKESSRKRGVLLAISLPFLGSLSSMGYICVQFLKLTPEELNKDPLYFVLAKRYSRDDIKGPSVSAAKVILWVLTFYSLSVLTFTVLQDIYNTPDISLCLVSNAMDVYVHMFAFAIWIAYKESTWGSALLWIVLILTFRGLALCIYLLRQLSYLSPHQHVSLILFNNKNRDLQTTDPLLMVHPMEE